jgi:hypothetical protein
MPTPEAKRLAVSKYMKELRSDPARLAAHNRDIIGAQIPELIGRAILAAEAA